MQDQMLELCPVTASTIELSAHFLILIWPTPAAVLLDNSLVWAGGCCSPGVFLRGSVAAYRGGDKGTGHMGTGCAVPPALRAEELSFTWFIYQYVWHLFLLWSLLSAEAGKWPKWWLCWGRWWNEHLTLLFVDSLEKRAQTLLKRPWSFQGVWRRLKSSLEEWRAGQQRWNVCLARSATRGLWNLRWRNIYRWKCCLKYLFLRFSSCSTDLWLG